MAKKKKKTGIKRPIAVTVTAVVITVLFFVRIYQAIKPLVEEKALRTTIVLPIFVGGNLTDHGMAVVESILFLLLAIGTIMVLIGFPSHAPMELGFPDGLDRNFDGGQSDGLFLFREAELYNYGIRCDHRICAQPGGCAADLRDKE